MIRINLLPHELRPVKRTPLPYVVSILVLFAVIGWLVLVGLANEREIRRVQAQIDDVREQLESKQATRQRYEELQALKQSLATKISVINDIAKDRIIWSRQLWKLSELAPDNIWYRDIKVGTRQFMETQLVVNPQTKKAEPKEVSVPKATLLVGGYVTPDDFGQADVNPLLISATSDEEFSSMFRFESWSAEDTDFEDYDVREFDIEFVIQPGGDDD